MRLSFLTALFTCLLCGTALAGEYPFTKLHAISESPYLKPQDLEWVDVDKDGDTDIVVCNVGTGGPSLGSIYWFENRRSGKRFVRRSVEDMMSAPADADLVDMDGDGDLDIVASGGGQSNSEDVKTGIRWFENLAGTAKVWKPHIVNKKAKRGKIAVLDVDGDGDFDVVGSDQRYGGAVWFENSDGKGKKWEDAATLDKKTRPRGELTLIDYDGDGRMDILSPNWDGGLSLWKNKGNGQFEEEKVADSKERVSSIQTIDFDNDGDTDVLFGLGEAVMLLEKDGDGYAAAEEIFKDERDDVTVKAADVDGDGAMDLLVAVRSQERRFSWVKLGGDEPKRVIIDKVSGDPKWLHVEDVDGDGDMDAFADAKGGWGLRWYENKRRKKK